MKLEQENNLGRELEHLDKKIIWERVRLKIPSLFSEKQDFSLKELASQVFKLLVRSDPNQKRAPQNNPKFQLFEELVIDRMRKEGLQTPDIIVFSSTGYPGAFRIRQLGLVRLELGGARRKIAAQRKQLIPDLNTFIQSFNQEIEQAKLQLPFEIKRIMPATSGTSCFLVLPAEYRLNSYHRFDSVYKSPFTTKEVKKLADYLQHKYSVYPP